MTTEDVFCQNKYKLLYTDRIAIEFPIRLRNLTLLSSPNMERNVTPLSMNWTELNWTSVVHVWLLLDLHYNSKPPEQLGLLVCVHLYGQCSSISDVWFQCGIPRYTTQSLQVTEVSHNFLKSSQVRIGLTESKSSQSQSFFDEVSRISSWIRLPPLLSALESYE